MQLAPVPSPLFFTPRLALDCQALISGERQKKPLHDWRGAVEGATVPLQ